MCHDVKMKCCHAVVLIIYNTLTLLTKNWNYSDFHAKQIFGVICRVRTPYELVWFLARNSLFYDIAYLIAFFSLFMDLFQIVIGDL